jgi:hypothetical protein
VFCSFTTYWTNDIETDKVLESASGVLLMLDAQVNVPLEVVHMPKITLLAGR